MKELDLNFSDPDLDTFILRWMEDGISEAELREWRSILLFNQQFREDYCDFIKAFRDPLKDKESGSIQ